MKRGADLREVYPIDKAFRRDLKKLRKAHTPRQINWLKGAKVVGLCFLIVALIALGVGLLTFLSNYAYLAGIVASMVWIVWYLDGVT